LKDAAQASMLTMAVATVCHHWLENLAGKPVVICIAYTCADHAELWSLT
jgi:hypothetical protein